MALNTPEGLELLGEVSAEYSEILTPDALRFFASLERGFRARRAELLRRRVGRQQEIDKGELPRFPEETRKIREDLSWKVAPAPQDLLCRWVEITGPASSRKMVINAFNSGADIYMGDAEDAESPTWDNLVQGQINLRDAIRRRVNFTDQTTGKEYKLDEKVATLIFRPRGWHLDEKHVRVDGKPVSGGMFDFALYFFHNARALIDSGSGPYFYLPKIQSYLEARLWNDVFNMAQDELKLPRGTIRATVLIETLPAAFEMEEILYELREHSAGLNCGRWDYIFSFIKTFREYPDKVLPDRVLVTMDKHFLKSYVDLLVQTCHKRGAYAMGGMAAQIPIRNNPEANAAAMGKVRADKEREVRAGHDGTWVAHPGLVEVARDAFAELMAGPNQLHKLREDVKVTGDDLVKVPEGPITYGGLKWNISVGTQYLEAWLRGTGCVPLYHLMEDAATTEISRTQVWQWIRHGAKLEDGRQVTPTLFQETLGEVMGDIRREVGAGRYEAGKYKLASEIFAEMSTGKSGSSGGLPDFLTLRAYEYLA
ncbi:MAG: malate synthase A [Nitrospinota bacterium]